jgi:uncharacterized membrane protein YgdD (TMEM256/DUF423 family)
VSSNPSPAFALGAFVTALGVLLGAFAAHALSALPATELGWWHTGTRYLFVGAVGMMLWGLFDRTPLSWLGPCTFLGLGVLLFSGSLYAMALGGPRLLGAITPMGGILLVVGFVYMGVQSLRHR